MKTIAVIVVVLLLAVGFSFSYRAYKERTAADLASRRQAIAEKENETRRLAEAKVEAQRLTALQAEQAVTDAEHKLELMRQEEEVGQQRRMQAEAEAARLNRELEDLRRQKDSVIAAMQKTAEQRQAELATIENSRKEALAKLQAVETEKSQLATRETAHAEALKKQIELEKQAQERAARFHTSSPR